MWTEVFIETGAGEYAAVAHLAAVSPSAERTIPMGIAATNSWYEEREWPGLWKHVEVLLPKSGTLVVEDAGYIVLTRTLELTLTGDEAKLKALVAKLKPIFKGRTGAEAVLKLALFTAKGRSFKLA